MGTTAEKLNKLLTNKADIKSALTEQRQTPGDVMSTYADKIRAIEPTWVLEDELSDQDTNIAELQAILSTKAKAFASITNDGNGNVVIATNGASATYSNGNLTIKQKG